MTGIYTITSPTNQIYVGRAVDISSRKSAYKHLKCKNQTNIYNSILKYSWEAHKFEVVMTVRRDFPHKWLDLLEQFFMDYYRAEGYELMNLKAAGKNGALGSESKRKLSISLSGKKHSEETKRKIGESNTGLRSIKSLPITGYILVNKNSVVTRYHGVSETFKATGISKSKIYKMLKNGSEFNGVTLKLELYNVQ